ncbi:hypothetical protein PR003_g1884 [Phytophthora rubi]|uniref:Tyrosine-protein kinase ephrin type A/B receptor-like domain-containing protein n=1 Tax=Phytophthora rubi TaxID=129364 RepID=A0A6A3P6N5_9STRA|nr:hypothetical protein PR002_g1747 [Phytophthora rubi]KAE9051205.1 hypothetical protein PR001_g1665 [Phytophthora rubi]KAE9357256.1 hypothetical protein PR003_g1884 [Phytophthora rubi]
MLGVAVSARSDTTGTFDFLGPLSLISVLHSTIDVVLCSEIGTITPAPCPAGTYGDVEGLISSACSSTCSSVSGVISCIPSPCPAGYYCPLATTVPLECGSTSIFCPKGSPVPTTATTGYHTTWKAYSGTSVTGEQLELQYVEGYSLAIQNQTTRSDQHICEKGSYCSGGVKKLCLAGTYGGSEGLSTVACTAPCPAGYYCPKGAADYTQYPCTSRTSFCRQGSSVPNAVDTGYYTVATQAELRTDEIVCPTGSYCIGGVQYFCPERTYGNTTGLASKACSGKCQNGFLCPQGSTSATQSPCPAGNYCIRGVKFLCPEGTYGATANLTSKACSGRCQDGYECPRGSTSPTQSQCSAGSYSRNAKMCAPCYPGNWCDITPPDCGADYAFCPL